MIITKLSVYKIKKNKREASICRARKSRPEQAGSLGQLGVGQGKAQSRPELAGQREWGEKRERRRKHFSSQTTCCLEGEEVRRESKA